MNSKKNLISVVLGFTCILNSCKHDERKRDIDLFDSEKEFNLKISNKIPYSARFEFQTNKKEFNFFTNSYYYTSKRYFAVRFFLPHKIIDSDDIYPLVLFSSSLNESVDYSAQFLAEIANQGYIVASLEHRYIDSQVYIKNKMYSNWLSIFHKGKMAELFFLSLNDPFKPSPWLYSTSRLRINDVKCLLNFLGIEKEYACKGDVLKDSRNWKIVRSLDLINSSNENLDKNDEKNYKIIADHHSSLNLEKISLKIDSNKIGYIGHSDGGSTAQYSISKPLNRGVSYKNEFYLDKIKAVIDIDGGGLMNRVKISKLDKPFLYLASAQLWRDNHDIKYIWNGSLAVPVTKPNSNCKTSLETKNENCELDPVSVKTMPFHNSRKHIFDKVACFDKGYAFRVKETINHSYTSTGIFIPGQKNISENFKSYRGNSEKRPYEIASHYSIKFLDFYLKNKKNSQKLFNDEYYQQNREMMKIYADEDAHDSCFNGSGKKDINSPDIDSDGDGLTNWEERELFISDPSNPDSNNNGISDGEEVLRQKMPFP